MSDIVIDPPARVRIEQVDAERVRVMVDTDNGTHVLVCILGHVVDVQRYKQMIGCHDLRRMRKRR